MLFASFASRIPLTNPQLETGLKASDCEIIIIPDSNIMDGSLYNLWVGSHTSPNSLTIKCEILLSFRVMKKKESDVLLT